VNKNSINIGRDNNGVALQQTRVSNSTIQTTTVSTDIPSKPEECLDLIMRLESELEFLKKQDPKGAERVLRQLKSISEELKSKTPDKIELGISAKGLLEAANAIKAIASPVLLVAEKIANFIARMT
jgi:hypothetical protein